MANLILPGANPKQLRDMGDGSFAEIIAIDQFGDTVVSSAAFSRPADTTAYLANDVVINATSNPTHLAFLTAARGSGRGGYITKVRIATDQEANVASYRLWLWYNTPPATLVDNSPMGLLWAQRAVRLGYVDVGPMTTEDTGVGDHAEAQVADVRFPYYCATSTLFGVLETKTAFTPASAQQFYVELTLERS